MSTHGKPYLMWYNDNKKTPIEQHIADGCAVYERRFGVKPTTVLVHPGQLVEVRERCYHMVVESREWVRPNLYLVGRG